MTTLLDFSGECCQTRDGWHHVTQGVLDLEIELIVAPVAQKARSLCRIMGGGRLLAGYGCSGGGGAVLRNAHPEDGELLIAIQHLC